MFETMSAILMIDSDECRHAALHGLSHLHHPGTLDSLKRCGLDLPFLDDAWCQDYKTESLACGIRTRASPLADALSYFLQRLILSKFAALGMNLPEFPFLQHFVGWATV